MAAMAASRKRERLDVRVTPEQKGVFRRAAARSGKTLTEFVVETLEAAVEETVRPHSVIKLSPRDSILFVETLLDPPGPNDKLRAAADRYRAFFGE